MKLLKSLFEYQRFAGNPRLQRLLDDTAGRCVPQGEALEDEWLDVSAAGEPENWQAELGKERTDAKPKH